MWKQNSKTKYPIIVSIEGNIGSGKSTLMTQLKKHYQSNKEILFVDEPVNEWMKITDDDDGKNMIEKFYSDQKKYSFAFQMMAYISRLKLIKSALKNNADYRIIITERSVNTDKNVFAKMLYDEGNMESVEYQIYNKWFYDFMKEIPAPSIIYIKTSPVIAKARVDKRQRLGEDIPLDYLIKCNDYHENWLNNSEENESILKLDGNIEMIEGDGKYIEWIKIINSFIGIEMSSANKEDDFKVQESELIKDVHFVGRALNPFPRS